METPVPELPDEYIGELVKAYNNGIFDAYKGYPGEPPADDNLKRMYDKGWEMAKQAKRLQKERQR